MSLVAYGSSDESDTGEVATSPDAAKGEKTVTSVPPPLPDAVPGSLAEQGPPSGAGIDEISDDDDTSETFLQISNTASSLNLPPPQAQDSAASRSHHANKPGPRPSLLSGKLFCYIDPLLIGAG